MDKYLENLAKESYQSLLKSLDEIKWHYTTLGSKMAVRYTVNSKDLPIEFYLKVDAETQLIIAISRLPLRVIENKRAEIALAVNHVNFKLADGNFDFDVEKGLIYYKMSISYRDSLIGDKLVEYLLNVSAGTVDRFNDKFDAIAKGELSIDEFLE